MSTVLKIEKEGVISRDLLKVHFDNYIRKLFPQIPKFTYNNMFDIYEGVKEMNLKKGNTNQQQFFSEADMEAHQNKLKTTDLQEFSENLFSMLIWAAEHRLAEYLQKVYNEASANDEGDKGKSVKANSKNPQTGQTPGRMFHRNHTIVQSADEEWVDLYTQAKKEARTRKTFFQDLEPGRTTSRRTVANGGKKEFDVLNIDAKRYSMGINKQFTESVHQLSKKKQETEGSVLIDEVQEEQPFYYD